MTSIALLSKESFESDGVINVTFSLIWEKSTINIDSYVWKKRGVM